MKYCVSISNDIFFLFEQGGIKLTLRKDNLPMFQFADPLTFVELAKNRLISSLFGAIFTLPTEMP